MAFNIGDKVEWASQSQGYTATKIGTIVATVPAGEHPQRDDFPDLFAGAGCGLMGRKHESYVVAVQFPRSVRHYWPRVKNLKLVAAAATASHSAAATEETVRR
jgi:hypothetical protein